MFLFLTKRIVLGVTLESRLSDDSAVHGCNNDGDYELGTPLFVAGLSLLALERAPRESFKTKNSRDGRRFFFFEKLSA